MRIGFTGTREGMAWPQYFTLTGILLELLDEDPVFTHGDCLGADAEAAEIARALGYQALVQPCDIARMRAHVDGLVVLAPLPPLERNKNIVDFCDILLACPKEEKEKKRSGTWSTVRYARRTWTQHYIIYPGGNLFHRTYQGDL